MVKRFFSAIILAFAFLFLNLGFNTSNVVLAQDDLPENIFANAGIGEKLGYWAIVNYGADYIGDTEVTIDIQQEAIANEYVNSIAIVESGYSLTDLVHYERNVSSEFASKITYTLKNKSYGEKYITILLLTEFSYNPSDSAIVDKIIVGVDQKRNIGELTPEDILIIKENEENGASPYKVNVTLPEEIPGKGKIDEYVFKDVTYLLQGSENQTVVNALYESVNNYYFTVRQNGTYLIEITDVFGYTLRLEVVIDNLRDPEIVIEINPSVTGPINHSYPIDVIVKFFDTDYILSSDDLSVLQYEFNGNTTSIKDSMQIIVDSNGVYSIYARSLNLSEAEFVFEVTNIDKEAPFVQILETMTVYTESVNLFNPLAQVFVYDNVTLSENIIIEASYYTVVGGSIGSPLGSDFRQYLYTVRDIIVRYKVTDEAGNSVERDSYVVSVDNTNPTINKTYNRTDFYINDPYPTAAEIEAKYGIIVTDNSLYPGSPKTIEYYLDFSRLPVDENQRLNVLGEYNIFVRAVDEAGNVSASISLIAEVRARKIHVEADYSQYIIYGDKTADDIVVTYHCVTREGNNVPCSEELLEGDSISGELYILNAHYVGDYKIYYNNLRVPSDLYYLHYEEGAVFTIKQRTIKVIAHDKEKYYLDDDPALTYEIDMRVCDPTDPLYNQDYRCTFAPNTGDRLIGDIERYMGNPEEGIEIWMDEGSWSVSEAVWYDTEGNLVARRIMVGTLHVYEQYNGGVDNYYLDFGEGAFLIKPKHISVYIESASKIYGEDDIEFSIKECRGAYPINGATIEFCQQELRVTVYRTVEGETVVTDAYGNYIDYYLISGSAANMNYQVEFFDAYLTILRRDISISVKGDLDENGNPTGKYTIYYEDNIPYLEVYDSSVGTATGLVNNANLGIADKFSPEGASLYTQGGDLITEYVNGIGVYVINKGSLRILDKDNMDAEYNYNVTFNPGELEVIRKEIWIKIIKDLSKVYGDEDKVFTDYDLTGYDEYVILEANGRFVIEITPSSVEGEEPYIPRDNDRMKYHLIRAEGIYVGYYPITIEKLEGCENYDVYLFQEYKFEIVKRLLRVSIENQTIIYKEVLQDEIEFTVGGDIIDGVWVDDLQYADYLEGTPDAGEYRNVGVYQIGVGSIRVYADVEDEKLDVTNNYTISTSGGVLKIVQREVSIEVKSGQGKQYGNDDPKLEFIVYYNGVIEEMLEYDYKGWLGRDAGEEPGDYAINWGTFELILHGKNEDGERVANYLITEFRNYHPFRIEKRTILVKARDVSAIYGNEYQKDIVYDTSGSKLAYNLTLEIDGSPIYDILDGSLKILGTVDGVGTYTISCEDIKIVRRYTGEDVTHKYYNYSFENGTLTIVPRTIKITPDDGQFKKYGESDIGITFTYTPALLDEGDEFVGTLKRTPRDVNGVMVTEDVGEYLISLGTLSVNTPSGKPNYELVLDGSRTFTINPRSLVLKASDIEIYYGDPFELAYTISGDGVANNPDIGVVDSIEGELNLDREYAGYGTYRILGDNITVTNIRNYNYSFLPGLLIVNKRVVTITPSESTLYKVYGEDDPDYFKFTIDFAGATYTGELDREPGEDVGKYRILLGTLSFGPNFDMVLNEAYFTVMARIIEVKAENNGKLYGTADPQLTYNYIGTLIGNDRFYGSLVRDAGEEVGEYEIMQGSLSINSNYQIIYTPGVFTIRYAEFTGLTIYSLTSNQYQVKGEEEEVRLYVRFNEGADETNIGDVVWTIIKNEELEWEFTKDPINNIISFFPSGSIGTYVVSASYGGKTAYYEVFVEIDTVGTVYIRWVNGSTEQILGKEERITYMVIVPENASSDATVQWIINGTTIKANKVTNIYFDYTPNLGKGEYKIQAKIGGKTSDPLFFYVRNNNPPVITLNGNPVVYIEAKTGVDYIEQGATVIDDIDGDITDSLVITGYVNEEVKGTYYIKYDAKDSHGNNAISVYRQVVVRDTTPPVVNLIGNREIKLLYGQAYVEYGATAVDNYDGPLEVLINNPIIIDKIGTYEVTYVAYDESGNRGSTVRYVEIIDNVSPVITLIGDEVTYVEVYSEFKDEGALVEDNVDGTFIMPGSSFYFGEELVNRIDTSRLGTYYVHYDYQDTAGNIGAGKVRIVIVRDSTPPVIVLNGTNPYIIRYSYPELNYEEPGAVAKDNYDSYVPVTITGQIGNELGTYYLYYDAVDAHGNIAQTVTREIIVVDVQNPIIHFYAKCPQYITIEALYEEYDLRCDAPGYGIWVEDDYMEDLDELQKRVVVTGTVDNTRIGLYTIRYDVSDMAGNAAVTLNRYVEVVDTTAPTITLKCANDLPCEDDTSQIVEVFTMYEEFGAIVYDRYDEYHGITVNLVVNHNINVNKLGEYIVTYNATDSNGNKAEPVIRRVYVKDTTPPVVTLIGENPITIERGLEYVEYGATAIDNYDGPMPHVTIINAPSGMALGVYEVIYKAIDSSGNVGEATRIVYVVDTIPPIVLGVEDGKYYKEPVSIYFIPTLGTDEKLIGWLNGEEISSPHFVEAEGEYNLLVRDDAGNETRIWFAIDSTPPQILGVRNGEYTNREVVEVYSNEKIKYYEYRYQNGEWVRTDEQVLSFSHEGTYRVYAVDMADNVSSVVMFVVDRTAPNFSLTGVINKGITNTDVNLITEENATIAVNSKYNIPTLYTFTNDGYYQVVIRDLAGNTVNLQFVINKTRSVIINEKLVNIISQHNAIDKVSISGTSYSRNNGILIAMPLIDGGFQYVSGKLFSESEYQTLISGGIVEIKVAGTDDTYMFVGFVVEAEELNKFGSQTVDGDESEDGGLGYAAIAFLIFALVAFFFVIFLKRRKKEEEEEEEEEIIYEDM